MAMPTIAPPYDTLKTNPATIIEMSTKGMFFKPKLYPEFINAYTIKNSHEKGELFHAAFMATAAKPSAAAKTAAFFTPISPDANGLFFLTACFLSYSKSQISFTMYTADASKEKVANPSSDLDKK